MDRKLILNEDIFEDNNEIIENEVVEDEIPVSGMLNQLIKSEWDIIDLYNSMIASIENNEDVKAELKDIVSDSYIHVGQLEKLLQGINPVANEIETGKEGTDSLGDVTY